MSDLYISYESDSDYCEKCYITPLGVVNIGRMILAHPLSSRAFSCRVRDEQKSFTI